MLPPVDVVFGAVHIGADLGTQNIDDFRHFVGVPRRRMGICSISISVPGDNMEVSILPGAMALTRMP
jgi:hypothetical protein